MSVVSVFCRQIQLSASGRSLVLNSPAECHVSECDLEASIMRRLWPTRDRCAMERSEYSKLHCLVFEERIFLLLLLSGLQLCLFQRCCNPAEFILIKLLTSL